MTRARRKNSFFHFVAFFGQRRNNIKMFFLRKGTKRILITSKISLHYEHKKGKEEEISRDN